MTAAPPPPDARHEGEGTAERVDTPEPAAEAGGGRALLGVAVRAGRLAARAARGPLLLYLGSVLVGAALPVAVAWLTKLVLDLLAGAAAAPASLLATLAVGTALAGALAAVLPKASQYWEHELERRTGAVAQDELFRAVERLSGLARFESPAFLDRLRLATQAADQTSTGSVAGAASIAGAVLTAGGFLASLFVLAPVMSLVLVAAALPALLAEISLSRARSRMLVEIGPVERRQFFYSQLLGTVAAAKEIRLFGTGPFLRGRMLRERLTANAARRRMDRRELRVQGGLATLSAAVAGAGLVWVVLAANAGRLTVGDVALFVAAIAGVQAALAQLVHQFAQTHHMLLLFQHFVGIVDAEPDLPSRERAQVSGPLGRAIELVDVWFRYSDEHPWVLRGVNLTIPAGCAVALVGRNGAGKSTIVKLLCRFYDPTRGSILWDGTDLRDVAPEALRARIGAVFQDFMEYDLPAADVIALGDLSAREDRPRIEQAARLAGVHDDLTRLPRGYDTLLTRLWSSEGDRDDPATGVVPSGGQWQRLALARGFLRDRRDLLILDEPSSGLDAEAEHAIHTRLAEHRRGRTSVLVSHRLGTVRDADLIAVLDAGRVVEQGSHRDLQGQEGLYAHLFSLQARGYEQDDDQARAGSWPPGAGAPA